MSVSDLSDEELMEATMTKCTLVRWRL